MSGELYIEKRVGELQMNQRILEMKIGGMFALIPQYRIFSDRVTKNVDLSQKYIRCGMRGGIFVTDTTLTLLGFNGTENIDWLNNPLGGGGSGTGQYYTYTDGVSVNPDLSRKYFRTGMRGAFYVLDATLTSSGFAGIENTDWLNIDAKI